MDRDQRLHTFKQSLESRILLLDGAMGTMIQGYRLSGGDFRGDFGAARRLGAARRAARHRHLRPDP